MPPLAPAQEHFRTQAVELARRIAPAYRVDWRLMAAAAILESGWGESPLARRANNCFGIQAVPSDPPECVHVLRTPSGAIRFRRYDSVEESFRAYGRLLARSSHYAPAREACAALPGTLAPAGAALRERLLLETFLHFMAPVYCPEDPDYEDKILQIIALLE